MKTTFRAWLRNFFQNPVKFIMPAVIIILIGCCAYLYSNNRDAKRQIADLTERAKKLGVCENEKDLVLKQLHREQEQQEAVEITRAKQEAMKKAIVGKGEGPEHTFIRQLIDDPQVFGFDGDVKNIAAVKIWAQRKAHNIAVEAGYYDWKFGGWVATNQPNKVAYVLETINDSIFVKEFVKESDDNFPDTPENIRQTASSYSQAKFLAHEDKVGNFVTSESYQSFHLPQ
jgi:hypothetical protein